MSSTLKKEKIKLEVSFPFNPTTNTVQYIHCVQPGTKSTSTTATDTTRFQDFWSCLAL